MRGALKTCCRQEVRDLGFSLGKSARPQSPFEVKDA